MRTLLIAITSIVLAGCSSEEPTPAAPAKESPPKAASAEATPAAAPAASPAKGAPAKGATSAPAPNTVGNALAGKTAPDATPAAADRGPVVASVLGHPIYAGQIEINQQTQDALRQAAGAAAELADERIELLRQMRLSARVVNPLIDAEVARRTLAPSDDAINAVLAWGRRNLESRLELARAELADPATNAERRLVLERQIQYNQRELENSAADWKDSDDPRHQQRRGFAIEVAKKSIERWRFQKALYEEYGGPITVARVGPPQPTAPVAMRKWLAACVERGDLVFEDEALQEAFLDYQMADDPKQMPADESFFDVPWWEQDP